MNDESNVECRVRVAALAVDAAGTVAQSLDDVRVASGITIGG